MAKEGIVIDMSTAKRAPRRRDRVSPLASKAVAYCKQRQAQLLEAALNTPDGDKAEKLRCIAVGLDEAATLILLAFDDLSRRPML